MGLHNSMVRTGMGRSKGYTVEIRTYRPGIAHSKIAYREWLFLKRKSQGGTQFTKRRSRAHRNGVFSGPLNFLPVAVWNDRSWQHESPFIIGLTLLELQTLSSFEPAK